LKDDRCANRVRVAALHPAAATARGVRLETQIREQEISFTHNYRSLSCSKRFS
jgi:hypothetical protein